MESTDRQLAGLVRSAGFALAATVPMGDFAALDRAHSQPPEVLLLDLRGQGTLPAELPAFKRRYPKTGVVILSSQLDPKLMLEAMRAGVTEWVIDPLAVADLKAAVDRVIGQHSPSTKPAQVIGFLGAKGGVGTTTLAVNVAAVLAAETDSKVLMIDLHVAAHGDAALLLGAEPRFSIVDALENAHRLDEAFLETLVVRAKSGLDLLAAPDRPSYLFDAAQMRALLENVATYYQCVVLDVPHGDLRILDALEAASNISLVVDQELPTVRRATKLASVLKQRHGKDRVSAVVMRYDPRAEIGQDDIERVVGLPVWAMLPSDYRLAIAAVNSGRPLVIENKTRLPMAIRQLAGRLRGPDAKITPADGPQPKRVGARRLGFAGLF
jgi:pilus assembly protein CpaE